MKYSKEGQDVFALTCFPKPGYFLDIGCAHPEDGNNTVLLEEHGWKGMMFDINPHVARIPAKRTAPIIIGDCAKTNIIADSIFPTGIRFYDYISFDVDDGTEGTIARFPWRDVRFGCMTFEHDKRDKENSLKQQVMDRMLRERNYTVLARDVCYEDNGLHIFEDWWVDPKLVSERVQRWVGQITPGQSWRAVLSTLSSSPLVSPLL